MKKEEIKNLKDFLNSDCNNISILTSNKNNRSKITDQIFKICNKNTILYTVNKELQDKIINTKPEVKTTYINPNLQSLFSIDYISKHLDNCDVINFNTIIIDNIQDLCSTEYSKYSSENQYLKAQENILQNINYLSKKLSNISFKYGIHIIFIFNGYNSFGYDYIENINIDNFLDCYIGKSIIDIC